MTIKAELPMWEAWAGKRTGPHPAVRLRKKVTNTFAGCGVVTNGYQRGPATTHEGPRISPSWEIGKRFLRTQDRPPAAIRALNERIAALAKKHRVVYLDYHRALVDDNGALKAELTDDGLHPNAAGYAVMAPMAEKALETLVQ